MDKYKRDGAMARHRSEVAKLIVAAVVLTLGVNMLTAPLLNSPTLVGLAVSLAGGALVLAALIFASIQALRSAGYQRKIRAVIIMEGEDRKPVAIDGYEFSEKTSEFLLSLFAEIKTSARTWKGSTRRDKMPSKPDEKMVLELSEYYFLNRLSSHLSAVFNGAEETRVVSLERGDIPEILLSNRFLETFSRDMNARDAFGDHYNSTEARPRNAKVVAAYGKGGAYFDLFELTLPKGSKISRDQTGRLKITTGKFVLSYHSTFVGFYGSTPYGFDPLYLGVDFDKYDKRMIEVDMTLSYKFAAIFSIFGWHYFAWVEEFIDEFEKNISFDDFINDCGWRLAYTTNKILAKNKGRLEVYQDVRTRNAKQEAATSSSVKRKTRKK